MQPPPRGWKGLSLVTAELSPWLAISRTASRPPGRRGNAFVLALGARRLAGDMRRLQSARGTSFRVVANLWRSPVRRTSIQPRALSGAYERRGAHERRRARRSERGTMSHDT